ncbi:MAG TPA: hypothetical protein PK398_02645 [Candidatus Gracilibacteria bacterium]|nr:hypothetical protein [Candidatus Gracilibacteria bacterium]
MKTPIDMLREGGDEVLNTLPPGASLAEAFIAVVNESGSTRNQVSKVFVPKGDDFAEK